MSILIAFLIVFAAGILILFVRAEICKIKGRTLAKKKRYVQNRFRENFRMNFQKKF